MIRRTRRLTLALAMASAATLLAASPGTAAGDPKVGETAFQTLCAACHTVKPGQNGYGPSLAGLNGRKSGTAPNFNYTDALAHAGVVWSGATLDKFLSNPTAMVPGTAMQIEVDDAKQRGDIVAYLTTLKAAADAPAVAPVALAKPAATGPNPAMLAEAQSDANDWLHSSRDYKGQRYSSLRQITTANAHELRPVCMYRSSTIGSFQSNPVVYKGDMVFTIDNLTVAIDAATCKRKWSNTWEYKATPLSKTNRGVAIVDGRVIRGTPDGYLIALNSETGELIWSKQIADPAAGQYLSMPPLVIGDTVIYGPAGADWGAKNWVGAFRTDNGEQVWKFNLIPDANEPGADTWKDQEARAHGGGSLWTPLSYDESTGVIYLPVGNPAPDFEGPQRDGDDLYTDSVVALDAKTGKMLWFKQFVSHDVHDRDLSQVSPLFEASANGKVRPLMSVAGKDGLLRVLDRETHEMLYQVEITTRTGWDNPPTPEGAHSCPGLLGGLEWNGPAFDRKTHALYVATVDWCGTFKVNPAPTAWEPKAHFYGGSETPDPATEAKGWLQAIDGPTGRVLWKRQWPTPLVAGIAATAGGVLFTGDLNNDFLAIDAENGKTLYRFNTGGAIGGGVITYGVGGKQYVATTSGVVSGFFGGNGPAAIVVFGLP